MRRINELIAEIRNKYPNDKFFLDFKNSCRIDPTKTKRKQYNAYSRSIMLLDDESWGILKQKTLQHYRDHRGGQRKQGFFNQLNEAFAYRYLVNKGFKNVRFIREGTKKKPDIKFNINGTQHYCEVKTLGISDAEINRRSSMEAYDGSVYLRLSRGFIEKFRDAVTSARKQIYALGQNGMVYIIIFFDDITLDYYQNYRNQLITFSKTNGFNNLFIKTGLLGNRMINLT